MSFASDAQKEIFKHLLEEQQFVAANISDPIARETIMKVVTEESKKAVVKAFEVLSDEEIAIWVNVIRNMSKINYKIRNLMFDMGVNIASRLQ